MVENISVWDIFRDLETNDIQNSEGIIERKYVAVSDLKAYQDDDDVIKNNLKKALAYNNQHIDETDKADSPKRRNMPEKVGNIERLIAGVRIPKGAKNERTEMT